jgi:nucleoside-diphosphate-sugar epimerase
MKTILVTGATGLIGSNICAQLVEKGHTPRTIARTPSSGDALALKSLGVDVLPGDIADLNSVRKATEGTDGVIHSAAMLGRPGSSMEEGFSSNVMGTLNVLTAAASLGGIPVIQVLTTTFFDMWDKTLTEHSPLDLLLRNTDAYTITKRLAYVEGVARVADGQDIRFMMPGAVFGPSICVGKAMIRPSFNDRIASAIRGELDGLIPIPVPYVLAGECAYVCIAALEKGARGEKYIAHGRQEDVGTIAQTCNRACELAGVAHRVREVPRDKLDDPDVIAKYGATMTSLAKRTYPSRFSDSSFTQKRLGYVPAPLDEGLKLTIDWMRRHQII